MLLAWAASAGYSQSTSRPSKPRFANSVTLLLANIALPVSVDAIFAKLGE